LSSWEREIPPQNDFHAIVDQQRHFSRVPGNPHFSDQNKLRPMVSVA
jgi:hypothetical protein